MRRWTIILALGLAVPAALFCCTSGDPASPPAPQSPPPTPTAAPVEASTPGAAKRTGCLDRPDSLSRPDRLPCELIPPGVQL